MQSTKMTIPDPARARAYFEAKMAFTTGPVELDRLIKSRDNQSSPFTVVDVRAAEDFAKGHIPGALNLPQGTWESAEGLSKDRTNIVYCYSIVCHLAANACAGFAAKGYPVMELEGGFESWKEHELEVESEPTNRLKKATERLLHRRH
jgi:rhodanese-related sulfurtransferase